MFHLLESQLEEQVGHDESLESELEPEMVRVLEVVGHESMLVDEVVSLSGLTAEAVSSIIMRLEILGEVASAPGGRVTRLH